MKPREVLRFEHRLDTLVARASHIRDIEELGHWSRYICVLVSGYLEVSVREILLSYSRNRSQPQIFRYVSEQLQGFQNPKHEKVCQLIASFDEGIAEKVRQLDDSIKSAVDSIVNNRHRIAHGQNTGIGMAQVSAYYAEAKKLIQFLCDEMS